MILLDSNVVIDLIDEDGPWVEWSRFALAESQARDSVAVSAVVCGETAARFASLAEQSDFLDGLEISTIPLGSAAAFRAGTAYRDYRRRGGTRESILADFLIGGHAVDLAAALITRDKGRFASYFPELTLITPETDHG